MIKDNFALVIIDMQNGYFKSDAMKQQQSRLVESINRLIDFTEKSGGIIVNVLTAHEVNKNTWTLNMLEDNKGFAFAGSDEVENVPRLNTDNAVKVIKARDSAFHQTNLHEILSKKKIKSILLCGVSTHSCIFQTASDAYAFNLKVTIVKDAIFDEDVRAHKHSLEYLEQSYRQAVLTCQDILQDKKGHK